MPDRILSGSGSDAQVTLTMAADPNAKHKISKIIWSYVPVGTVGRLRLQETVSAVTTDRLDFNFIGDGKDEISFDPPYTSALNAEVRVRLEAGGTVLGEPVIGRLNIVGETGP